MLRLGNKIQTQKLRIEISSLDQYFSIGGEYCWTCKNPFCSNIRPYRAVLVNFAGFEGRNQITLWNLKFRKRDEFQIQQEISNADSKIFQVTIRKNHNITDTNIYKRMTYNT